MKSVIAENPVKTYRKGAVRELDDLSLDVEEGTVLGVLGPNGAGKTTVDETLTGWDNLVMTVFIPLSMRRY